jgi:hypothetical protein
LRRCTKCKVNDSVDWIRCDCQNKVGLYYIFHIDYILCTLDYVYWLSCVRDVFLILWTIRRKREKRKLNVLNVVENLNMKQ